MRIAFSLFLVYSYISASVQCENCSNDDKSFPAIPNMPGSIGPKWFGLRPCYNSGSGNAAISVTWITICFTIYSYKKNYCLQTTNFSILIAFFSSHSTKHNWHHNHHNHGRHQQKWPPSAPHEALRSMPTLWMDGRQPPSLQMYFFRGLRVCMALKGLLCSGDDAAPQHWSVLRAIHTLNGHKIYCSGDAK